LGAAAFSLIGAPETRWRTGIHSSANLEKDDA
jgi:hypothetical protein